MEILLCVKDRSQFLGQYILHCGPENQGREANRAGGKSQNIEEVGL